MPLVQLPDPAQGTRARLTNIVRYKGGTHNRLYIDEVQPCEGFGRAIDCIQDNEHKVPVFDVDSQTVSLYDCGCSFNLDNPIFTMSVDGFISKFLKQG